MVCPIGPVRARRVGVPAISLPLGPQHAGRNRAVAPRRTSLPRGSVITTASENKTVGPRRKIPRCLWRSFLWNQASNPSATFGIFVRRELRRKFPSGQSAVTWANALAAPNGAHPNREYPSGPVRSGFAKKKFLGQGNSLSHRPDPRQRYAPSANNLLHAESPDPRPEKFQGRLATPGQAPRNQNKAPGVVSQKRVGCRHKFHATDAAGLPLRHGFHAPDFFRPLCGKIDGAWLAHAVKDSNPADVTQVGKGQECKREHWHH